MNDTYNFVIVDNETQKIWESFKFPADIKLLIQVMERGGVVYSRMSTSNLSRGRF